MIIHIINIMIISYLACLLLILGDKDVSNDAKMDDLKDFTNILTGYLCISAFIGALYYLVHWILHL